MWLADFAKRGPFSPKGGHTNIERGSAPGEGVFSIRGEVWRGTPHWRVQKGSIGGSERALFGNPWSLPTKVPFWLLRTPGQPLSPGKKCPGADSGGGWLRPPKKGPFWLFFLSGASRYSICPVSRGKRAVFVKKGPWDPKKGPFWHFRPYG